MAEQVSSKRRTLLMLVGGVLAVVTLAVLALSLPRAGDRSSTSVVPQAAIFRALDVTSGTIVPERPEGSPSGRGTLSVYRLDLGQRRAWVYTDGTGAVVRVDDFGGDDPKAPLPTPAQAESAATRYLQTLGRSTEGFELRSNRPCADQNRGRTVLWQRRDARSGAWLPSRVKVEIGRGSRRISFSAADASVTVPLAPVLQKAKALAAAKKACAPLASDKATAELEVAMLPKPGGGFEQHLVWQITFEDKTGETVASDCIDASLSGEPRSYARLPRQH